MTSALSSSIPLYITVVCSGTQAPPDCINSVAGNAVMVTELSVELAPLLSVTTTPNTRLSTADNPGAVNVGDTTDVDERLTMVPER